MSLLESWREIEREKWRDREKQGLGQKIKKDREEGDEGKTHFRS